MFESYWRVYVDVLIAEKYYFLYTQQSSRWIFAINVFCLICAVSGVGTFINQTLDPYWAAAIILFSQVVSTIQVLFPFTERLHAARNISSELSDLSLHAKIITDRYTFDKLNDDELLAELEWLQKQFQSVESKFAPPDVFPEKMKLHKKAQRDVEQYVDIHFVKEGDHSENTETAFN